MNFYLIIFVAYILSGDIASLKIIDTATSWRDLTQHEFSGWYSKTDRCILQHSRTVQKDPRRVKRDQCGSTDLLFDEKESGQLNVGYGYAGKICVPPLSDRRYFKKGLHNFTDPNAMYLVQALSAIYSSNRTLILLGDSMTGQTYDALLGEVARLPHISKLTRSNLSHNSLRNRILQSKGNYDQIQIKITGNIQLLEIFMIRINYINNIENSTFYEGNNINTWEKSKHLLYELIQEYNGIILLTNVGLWYNRRLTFSNEMKIYLNDLYNIANMSNKKNTVIWRESTASHFDRLPSGYYKYHDSHHMQCLPHGTLKFNKNHTKLDDLVDWRNIDIENLFKTLPYKPNLNLYLLRFYTITKPLHDMHLIQRRVDSRRYGYPSQTDCNHYCWMPLLWQPVWYTLYNVTVLV